MRLLVVEDDLSIANVLVRGLRERSFAVDHAADGEQAAYLGAVNPHHAVILDLALPKQDGLQVCRALRKRGSETRILMLTGGTVCATASKDSTPVLTTSS
jgi:two-component system OmpR family response regulator